jgi:hypothetical protein
MIIIRRSEFDKPVSGGAGATRDEGNEGARAQGTCTLGGATSHPRTQIVHDSGAGF